MTAAATIAQVVLEAVKLSNGLALKYASDELKNDRTVVLEAVKLSNGLALEYAFDELKNDEVIIKEVKKQ